MRGTLEFNSSVWHHSLTKENEYDLERIQKSAVKIILGTNLLSYEDALSKLNMKTLKERRNELLIKFTQKCLNVKQVKHLFPYGDKIHTMETRNNEEYKVTHCNTQTLKTSSIIQMQHILNRI